MATENKSPPKKPALPFAVPCRGQLCGASGSGKTYWLTQCLKRHELPFDAVWLFAPRHSLRQRGYVELAVDLDERGIELYPNEGLPDATVRDALLDLWARRAREGKHSLVIVDDLLSDLGKEDAAAEFVRILYISGRHINTSIICLVQHPRPKNQLLSRLNSTFLGLFAFSDIRSVHGLLQCLFGQDEAEQALEKWRRETSKTGGGLFVDLTRAHGHPDRLRGVDFRRV